VGWSIRADRTDWTDSEVQGAQTTGPGKLVMMCSHFQRTRLENRERNGTNGLQNLPICGTPVDAL
jgi:hypothetical protein